MTETKTLCNLGMNLLVNTQCQFLVVGKTKEWYVESLCIISYNHMRIYTFQNKSRNRKDRPSLYKENHVALLQDIKDLSIQVTHQVHGDEIQY